MKKLVLETTAPFQGLPELVAYDEGLFEKEGSPSTGQTATRASKKRSTPRSPSPSGVNPFTSHGKLFEQGKADMYNACEWGNYCRVGSTSAGSRQLGRRAIVILRRHGGGAGFAGLYPAATRQPRDRRAVLFRHPLHRASTCCEGFVRRDEIKLCYAPNGSRYRLDAVMNGEIDAATLTEPHVTLAEKKGCRTICSAFFHGTEVASERVDAETYAAFNRAVREAVRRINANKRAYLHYFIDYHGKTDPEVAALKVEDLREGRLVVCDPAPIPLDEMQRTYEWLKSWDMLEETASPAATRQYGRTAPRPSGCGVRP